MKKFISVFMCFVLILSLSFAGCKKENAKEETSTEAVQMNLDEIVKSESLEVEISQVILTRAGSDENLNVKLEEKKDSLYFMFRTNIKNLNTVDFNVNGSLDSKVFVDDTYEYGITILPAASVISPLQTQEFIFYVCIPDEVLESCKNYTLKMAFNDDFTVCSLDNAQHIYEYKGTVDEYGSPDSVINFETFAEYAAKVAEKYENIKVKKDVFITTCLDVSVSGMFNHKKLDDGVSCFYINAAMDLLYFDLTNSCINSYFNIIFDVGDSPENVFYSYAEKMEISSSAGSLSLGEDDRSIDGTYGNIGRYETTFSFNNEDTDFEQLRNIIDGDNLTITVEQKVVDSDNITVTFECNEEMKTAMRTLLDYDSELVKTF